MSGRIDPPSTKRPALPPGNPRLTREYKMEQGLSDQSRHGPELEPPRGVSCKTAPMRSLPDWGYAPRTSAFRIITPLHVRFR